MLMIFELIKNLFVDTKLNTEGSLSKYTVARQHPLGSLNGPSQYAARIGMNERGLGIRTKRSHR